MDSATADNIVLNPLLYRVFDIECKYHKGYEHNPSLLLRALPRPPIPCESWRQMQLTSSPVGDLEASVFNTDQTSRIQNNHGVTIGQLFDECHKGWGTVEPVTLGYRWFELTGSMLWDTEELLAMCDTKDGKLPLFNDWDDLPRSKQCTFCAHNEGCTPNRKLLCTRPRP